MGRQFLPQKTNPGVVANSPALFVSMFMQSLELSTKTAQNPSLPYKTVPGLQTITTQRHGKQLELGDGSGGEEGLCLITHWAVATFFS